MSIIGPFAPSKTFLQARKRDSLSPVWQKYLSERQRAEKTFK